MGCYVNPPDMSKELWLLKNGRPVQVSECQITLEEVPVVLVDNGMFTAAGVAYSHHEFDTFASPDDFREKSWYMVPRDKLYEITNLADYER